MTDERTQAPETGEAGGLQPFPPHGVPGATDSRPENRCSDYHGSDMDQKTRKPPRSAPKKRPRDQPGAISDPRSTAAAEWRRRLGMTQDQLARNLGCSASYVRMLESGRTSRGEPIAIETWRFYRNACRGIATGNDDWWFQDPMEIEPLPGLTVVLKR